MAVFLLRSASVPSALILRSKAKPCVSKDAPVFSGDSWNILRDGPAGLLRMRLGGRSGH
jgi:hypothetical protein